MNYQPAVEALRQLVEAPTVVCPHGLKDEHGHPVVLCAKCLGTGRIPDPLFNLLREALREKCPCGPIDGTVWVARMCNNCLGTTRTGLVHEPTCSRCIGGYITRNVEGWPSSAVAGLIVDAAPRDLIRYHLVFRDWEHWLVYVFNCLDPADGAIADVTEAIQRRAQEAANAP